MTHNQLRSKPAPPPWVTNANPSSVRRQSAAPARPKPANVNRYVRRAPPKKSPNTASSNTPTLSSNRNQPNTSTIPKYKLHITGGTNNAGGGGGGIGSILHQQHLQKRNQNQNQNQSEYQNEYYDDNNNDNDNEEEEDDHRDNDSEDDNNNNHQHSHRPGQLGHNPSALTASKSTSSATVSRWGNHPHAQQRTSGQQSAADARMGFGRAQSAFPSVAAKIKKKNSHKSKPYSSSSSSSSSSSTKQPPHTNNIYNQAWNEDNSNHNHNNHNHMEPDDSPPAPPSTLSMPPPPPVPKAGKIKSVTEDDEVDDCAIEHLLSNMHEGSECLANFHHALGAFSKQQISQSENFIKLFNKSRKRYGQMQSMPNFNFGMELIHNLLEETVQQQKQFAVFIQDACLPIIEQINLTCKEKYNEVSNENKKWEKSLSTSLGTVKQSRKKTQTAAERAVIARQKSEVTAGQHAYSAHSTHKKPAATKVFSGFANKFSHNSNLSASDSYSNAKELEKKFKKSVTVYNSRRLKYIERSRHGRKEVITTEHFRIYSMIGIFQTMVQKQKFLMATDNNKLTTLQQDILMHTTTMDAERILNDFIRQTVEMNGRWRPPPAQHTTLNVEYRDMFHSIADAMSITTEINPKAKIPLIMPLLCSKIKDLDGFQEQGLFRVSPAKTQLTSLKKRIQVKNFQMDESNVHVYAVLLKQWLRDLEDLVIPMRYYDYCVDMARQKKLNSQQFEVFFSQLESVNRETLKYLVSFLREMLLPTNVAATRMNLENIAIVFGPTLLRCDHEMEPQQAMINSKYEKDFVISLIQNS